jgi:hypothetical protein
MTFSTARLSGISVSVITINVPFYVAPLYMTIFRDITSQIKRTYCTIIK